MFIKTKVVEVTEEKAIQYSAVQKEKKELLDRLVVVENDSKRLHAELTNLTAVLRLIEVDTLGSFLIKNQFNVVEMFDKLPEEIKRVYPDAPVVDTNAKANTANTGSTNMDATVKATAVKVTPPAAKKSVVATKGKK